MTAPAPGRWAAWGSWSYASHRVAQVDGPEVVTGCGLRVAADALAVVTEGPGALPCGACAMRRAGGVADVP